MKDPLSEIENELRQMQPQVPDPALVNRIKNKLESTRPGTLQVDARFNWLTRSFLAAMAGLIFVCVLIWEFHPPSLSAKRLSSARTVDKPAVRPQIGGPRLQQVNAANYLIDAEDDGIVFPSASVPLRKVRYQYLATSQWKGKRDNTTIEVVVPGEDTVLIPLNVH